MKIIGLTGSIAMGKTTTSDMLYSMGIPVYDADKTIHELMGRGGSAVEQIGRVFPSAKKNGGIDRAILANLVFKRPEGLNVLESILHPLAGDRRKRFLAVHRRNNAAIVALDVPLLFETKHQHKYDYIVVVSAPKFLQARRALSRPGMTIDKLKIILGRQMPDFKKRQNADVVIFTGLGKAYTRKMLTRFLKQITN